MRTTFSILFSLLVAAAGAAVPAKLSNAYKSVITIVTYDASGKLLHSGNGFYISTKGDALADYALFSGASRAEVIDASGRKAAVKYITGANDIYDLVRFRVSVAGSSPLEIANNDADKGATAYVIPYAKKNMAFETRITDKSLFSGNAYYTLSAPNSYKNVSCPLLNADGQVIALLQKNVTKDSKGSCAISAKLGYELKMTPLNYNSATMRGIKIQKALPEGEEDATACLYLLSKTRSDSVTYLSAINDFIANYPQSDEGYTEKANYFAEAGQYAKAEECFTQAMNVTKNKAGIHYIMSKAMYQKALYHAEPTYANWTLEGALAEAEEAYKIDPQPLYLLQQGNCYYGLKKFQEAFGKFEEVNKTQLASPETFFYASKAKEKAGGNLNEVIALLDSALARFQKPYGTDAAPFLLERATQEVKAEKYREASFDYMDYERIVGYKNLNANFYYIREQAEMNAHMYQQALDDINRAVSLAPKEYLFQAEQASALLLTMQLDEAIQAAEKAAKLAPEEPAPYKILGIAYGEKKNKAKAAEYLNKAKSLGDTDIDPLLKKYK